ADVGGRRFDEPPLHHERGDAEGWPVHLQRLGPGRLPEGLLARRARVGVVAATPGARGPGGGVPGRGAGAGAALGGGVSQGGGRAGAPLTPSFGCSFSNWFSSFSSFFSRYISAFSSLTVSA